MGSSSVLGKPEDGKKILQQTLVKQIAFGAAVVGFMKTLISMFLMICVFCQHGNNFLIYLTQTTLITFVHNVKSFCGLKHRDEMRS